MKKIAALAISIVLLMGIGMAESGKTEGKPDEIPYTVQVNEELTHENDCIVKPTFYSTRRSRDLQTDKIQEVPGDGFSASMIKRQKSYLEYGLYLKFKPGIADKGFTIFRLDFICIDPSGNNVYTRGEEVDDLVLEYGPTWSYEFFSLDHMFMTLIDYYGSVPQGVYTIDIYFNGQYAGKTQFRVRK